MGRRLSMARRRATVAVLMSFTRLAGPRRSVLGLLMAVLALLGQVALGPIIPAQAAPSAPAPFADVPICHSGASGSSDSGVPVGQAHHGMQCALCPACHALAAAVVLPVPVSPLPVPPVVTVARHMLLLPARGPPAATLLAAIYPTGPPCLA